MFNNLSEKLDKALHTLKGHGKITEVNVAETLKEVRRALLDADVNFKIAKKFLNFKREIDLIPIKTSFVISIKITWFF